MLTAPSSISIHRISVLPAGLVNAFLVCTPDGAILVDSGLPNTEKKFERVLRQQGLGFSDVRLIVITHAHVDHAGNAHRLRELCQAPVLAHRGDLPYYLGEQAMTFCSTGWFGRVFAKTGAIQQPYPAFEPDILMDEDPVDLSPYGIPGQVIPTPGHTPGSISVCLQNQEAIVGDLISSGILLGGICCTHKAKRPPFEEDPEAVGKALKSLVHGGIECCYMGHGGPLSRQEVERHADWLLTLKPATATKQADPTSVDGH